jgi:hypothetical protein
VQKRSHCANASRLNVPSLLAQKGRCPAEIDGVPVDDGAYHEIESGGAECLTVKGLITDFTALMEEDGAT